MVEREDANDAVGNEDSLGLMVFTSAFNVFERKQKKWGLENIPKEALKFYVK
jgi:hypothetical protein